MKPILEMRFIPLVAIIIVCTSCKKDDPNFPSSSIIIGDAENMHVIPVNLNHTEYYTIYGVPGDGISIDLENDSIDDFNLWANPTTTPGNGIEIAGIINFSDSVFFRVVPNADTTFNTEWGAQYSFDGLSGKVIRDILHGTTCERKNAWDSVYTVKDLIALSEAGEELAIDQDWGNGYIYWLIHGDTAFDDGSWDCDESDDDTIFCDHGYWENSCNNVPFDTPLYVGIKKKYENGSERLGWVKFQFSSTPYDPLTGSAATMSVFIYEIALQM